jgi:FkbM family methyltransferase
MITQTKTFIRQVTPPFLLSAAKAALRTVRDMISPPTPPPVNPLKVEFDRLNAAAAEDEIVMREGLKLKLHPDSRIPFEHFCHISEEVVREMDCFIAQTRDKLRLLDVGALHGVFSLVFAAGHPDRKVVAVDASPVAYSRLLYNIYKNSLGNVTPVECALSSEPGVLSMHYEWEHAVAAKSDNPARKRLSVRKMTGDQLCTELSFHPDVIKIDVEGHEVKVIKGLAREIRENRPMVFLEVHYQRILDENDSIKDLLDVFRSARYEAHLDDGTPLPLDSMTTREAPVERLFLTPLPGPERGVQ